MREGYDMNEIDDSNEDIEDIEDIEDNDPTMTTVSDERIDKIASFVVISSIVLPTVVPILIGVVFVWFLVSGRL